MIIPAIRAKCGIWVYYIANLTYKQVEEHVKKVDAELHKSKIMQDALQRSITNNYFSIARYIENQPERFFNSLVLAIYDGDPKWREVRLDYGDDEEYYDIGLLELEGTEKIFPVDGQHRVEGIKKVLKNSDMFDLEQIPVILIGHRNDEAGMQRARRLFSTLNRYAKPVSKRDIIALDEDDCTAIVTRDLVEIHPLFGDGRISDAQTKALPKKSEAFTSIITLYECNFELLKYYLSCLNSDIDLRPIKQVSMNKVKDYIRLRPCDEEIESFATLCLSFWNSVSTKIDKVAEYLAETPPNVLKQRNQSGGNLFFRPAALIPLVKAVITIQTRTDLSFESIFEKINALNLEIDSQCWSGVLWDSNNRKMLTNNAVAVELLTLYYFDSNLLIAKEKERLLDKYASALQIPKPEARVKLGLELEDL